MKTKILLSIVLIVGALSGCSEGTSVPNTAALTQPANPYGMNYNNSGYYNNGMSPTAGNQAALYQYNPYLYTSYNAYANYNAQAQLRLQLQFNSRYNCAFRQSPLFYYSQYSNNNVAFRTTPNYSYDSCSCVRASSCDCARVVQQEYRNRCRYVARSNSSSSTSSSSSSRNNGCTETLSEAKKYFISVKDADAKALFDRLAHEKTTIKDIKGNEMAQRKGINYECSMSNDGSKDTDYVCDLTVVAATGAVEEIKNPGKAEAAQVTATAYESKDGSKNLVIDTANAATLLIATEASPLIYKNLTAPEVAGTVNTSTKNGVAAKIKRQGQIECYQTDEATECVINLKADTGAAVSQP